MKTLRNLCKQFSSSDSLSEREALQEKIELIAREYLNILYKNSLKYKTRSVFYHKDFRDDRGCLTYDYSTNLGIYVKYTDSWSYGGHCDETFFITFEDLESFDEEILEMKSIEDARSRLERDIRIAEAVLEKAKLELLKFNNETIR